MQTFEVDSSVPDIPSYRTAAEAIAAEDRNPRAKRSAADSLLIRRLELTGWTLTSQNACLELSNGYLLKIELQNGRVDWHILETSCIAKTEEKYGPFNLVWQSGTSSIWDPSDMLKARDSLQISKIFAGQIFVNVYFDRGGMLQFLPLWNSSANSLMLYFFELEPISRITAVQTGE